MNTWDLSTIYSSFESKDFQRDLTQLKADIEALNHVTLDDDFASSAKVFIEKANAILKMLYPLYAYANLTYSVDSDNNTALKYIDVLENIEANLTQPFVKFKKWVARFSKENIDRVQDDVLKQHQFFLYETHENAKYLLSDAEEVLLSKLQSTGSSAWSNLQAKITGELQVDFKEDSDMRPHTLSMLRNLAYHQSQDVRKRAYEAELKAYKQVETTVAASLNAIKGEVNLISKMRGFESPLHESVFKSRLDMHSLNAMIDAMEEKLPVFRKYLKRKGELLGHKNGLPFYDLFAPASDTNLKYTYEEAKDFVLKHFGSFSEELKESAKTAFDHHWVDVEPRKGKRGGAFCAHIEGRAQSRVMLNFDGSFSDVTTLAHELGHAYHNKQLYYETMLNNDYPMPLAETASIFCETIITNAATKDASKEDAIYILEKSIEGSTQVIVDILSRFLFEKAIFEARQEGPVSIEKMNDIMLEAQRKTYGDGLDPEYLHPYMWACKPHYYSAGFSFYNYPYAFGLLFALGLYATYQSGRENFVQAYNQLLKSTTRMNAKDVAATMGIDITDKKFWISSLEIVEAQIDEFLTLTN